ncbi:hypothetical protein EBT16_04205, partial [bacterium]|nr:hypothetical protein [bacterium]
MIAMPGDIIENSYLAAETVQSGYASPALNNIGYSNISAAICVPRTFFISAHAPSLLKIKFKSSQKIYLNGMLNRTTGIKNKSVRFSVFQENLLMEEFEPSLQYHGFHPIAGLEYHFSISC